MLIKHSNKFNSFFVSDSDDLLIISIFKSELKSKQKSFLNSNLFMAMMILKLFLLCSSSFNISYSKSSFSLRPYINSLSGIFCVLLIKVMSSINIFFVLKKLVTLCLLSFFNISKKDSIWFSFLNEISLYHWNEYKIFSFVSLLKLYISSLLIILKELF